MSSCTAIHVSMDNNRVRQCIGILAQATVSPVSLIREELIARALHSGVALLSLIDPYIGPPVFIVLSW